MPGAIFVSYRRATTSNAAGRLADRLMDRFGDDQVFVDVDAIEPGVDFVDVIEKGVAACRVLLVVIGPTWHTVTNVAGRRRLDDPYDPVVIEVRAGLANPGVRVIPVLVEGADMPREADLPPDLKRLARLNAARLEHASFRRDAARLMQVLERALATAPREEPILEAFPPATTSPDIAQARRLEDEPKSPEVRAQVKAAYGRAITGGHPDAPVAWAELGFTLVDDDDEDGLAAAEEAFYNAFASRHPTAEPMGRLGLALLDYIRDDLKAADKRLVPLTRHRYRAVAQVAASGLVDVRVDAGDYAGARAAYELAVELGDENPPSSWVPNAADELDAAGDVDGATTLLRWALARPTLDPAIAEAARERLAKRGLVP
jgi:TIR domain